MLGHENNHNSLSIFKTISIETQDFKMHWLWFKEHLKQTISPVCTQWDNNSAVDGAEGMDGFRWDPLWVPKIPLRCRDWLPYATFFGQSKSKVSSDSEWRSKLRLLLGGGPSQYAKGLNHRDGELRPSLQTTYQHSLWMGVFLFQWSGSLNKEGLGAEWLRS